MSEQDWMQDALNNSLQIQNLPEYKFYNGEVSVFYDDAEHTYMRLPREGEGEQMVIIPGCTTAVHIIDKSAALMAWTANLCRDYTLLKMEPGRNYTREELEPLLFEASKHYKDIVETAADIGKMAHNCLEQTIKHALRFNAGVVEDLVQAPEHPQSLSCCLAALDWMRKHNVRWVHTERKIYSRKHDFAGTLDGVALVDSCGYVNCCYRVEEIVNADKGIVTSVRYPDLFVNRLSVIDWKSSNRLYDEYRIQTAAYEAAIEEELKVDIQDRWVLRLGKDDGEFEPWHIGEEDFELDFNAFLDCLNLFRNTNSIRTRGVERRAALKAAVKAEKAAAKDAEKAAKKAEKEAIKAAKKASK